jgi:hypothetical protein
MAEPERPVSAKIREIVRAADTKKRVTRRGIAFAIEFDGGPAVDEDKKKTKFLKMTGTSNRDDATMHSRSSDILDLNRMKRSRISEKHNSNQTSELGEDQGKVTPIHHSGTQWELGSKLRSI